MLTAKRTVPQLTQIAQGSPGCAPFATYVTAVDYIRATLLSGGPARNRTGVPRLA